MVILYGDYDWKFDQKLFARHMEDWRIANDLTVEECDQLIGRKRTWHNWENYNQSQKDYNPRMDTLLKICSLADMYPPDYFIVQRKEVKKSD